MVIDTSALVAILLGEPDAERFARAVGDAPVRLLSAVNRVELSCVIEGRKGETGRADVEVLLRDGGFDIVTPQQAEIAIDAFRRFGRGRHRARLNIGDCFAMPSPQRPATPCFSRAMTSSTPTSARRCLRRRDGTPRIVSAMPWGLPAVGGLPTSRR
jgi:ribonuclease VapC